MKSAAKTCLSALVALSMTGCPIYPSDNRCRSDWDCASGYYCNEISGACIGAGPFSCSRPADCTGSSEVCSQEGVCEVGSCHLVSVGCVAGYTCAGKGQVPGFDGGSAWTCVPTSSTTGAGGSPNVEDAGATGGTAED